MYSEEQLIQATESSLFLPILPGRTAALNIPGVQGHYGLGMQGGFINRVGGSRLTSEQAPQVIKAVQDHFKALDQSFIWCVASSDTPDDLGEQLHHAGFKAGWTLHGMVLTDLDREFPMRSGVSVRRATPDDRPLVSQIYHVGFPMDDMATSDLYADMMETPSMVHYLVYLENVNEPVGATSMFYVSEYNAVILESSAILEEYRGQGIYKNLIAQRLEDARSDGMKLAVVQANIASAAPALRQLGFVQKTVIQAWRFYKK
jgi:GNAT superfamily N-acetyltransferase